MALITLEDFRDIYTKINQRGWAFIFSKFTFLKQARTKSAFNTVTLNTSNWWEVPAVKQRWNHLITGDANINYETFITSFDFAKQNNINLVSIGCGSCSHEIELAKLNPHWNIYCIDIANNLLENARQQATELQLTNMHFICNDIHHYQFDIKFDIVFFHSSLHHFYNIDLFFQNIILKIAKQNAKIIINEYVGANRNIFDNEQKLAINKCLALVPQKYRKIYGTNIFKNKYYGVGLIRMIIADPSECVDAENILPVLHKNCNIIVEKPFGGNLLMNVLKDIAYHFINLDTEKQSILNQLFKCEDEYMSNHKSDFVFGIYEIKDQ